MTNPKPTVGRPKLAEGAAYDQRALTYFNGELARKLEGARAYYGQQFGRNVTDAEAIRLLFRKGADALETQTGISLDKDSQASPAKVVALADKRGARGVKGERGTRGARG